MFIAILTLLSALSISGVAAYYSIIGLATIFPGAFIPVVLMGSVLEAGKLVCASWLYRNWKNTNFFLRSYLFFAVIVLSLVTSMGIFGFLSKAHLQNEFADGSVQQKIELINSQIKTEESIITRQQEIINRAFGKDTSTTVRLNQLNERLKQLDKEVEAYTGQGSSFLKGDLVKKGLELKKTQQAERDAIQKEIQTLTNKSTANTQEAENKIAASQKKITDLITKRDPLIADKLKLEAEIGPIKYIAALAVDFGWAEKVNANSAVRWVIIILIFVFDPLAVLMLVAANQSFIRKFPVREDPPEEIIDLEKPDLDPPPTPTRPETPPEDPAVTQWNSMIDRMNELAAKEREANNKKLQDTVKEWQDKLNRFNEKVEKPEPKEIEIVPVQDKSEDTTTYDLGNAVSNTAEDEVVKVEFKLEEQNNAKEKEEDQPEEVSISEQIEEAMESERFKPDFTEVIEPEKFVAEPIKARTGMLGQVLVDKKSKKPIQPLPATDFERTGMLNKLHQEHGKYEDVSPDELKKERDEENVKRFLEAVPVTEEDARTHPAITQSRMSFFEDYLDDIKRGDTEAENLPPDIAKTCAILLSKYDNPQVIEPAMPNTAVEQTGLSTMTSQELAEHFADDPATEDRDMSEAELDDLLKGFEEDEVEGEYDIVIRGGKKIKVPRKGYVQNEEQTEATGWNKIKELDLPEPEKNELDLPELTSTAESDIPEIADSIVVEEKLPADKITKHKNKMLSDEQYREKIEARINDLITKIENKEISLNDLTEEDRKVIIELLNNNE
jgi:hypothetical protein